MLCSLCTEMPSDGVAYFLRFCFSNDHMGGTVVSTIALQHGGSWFELGGYLASFCVNLACSLHGRGGFPPKTCRNV